MKLWSNGWINGAAFPARFALDLFAVPGKPSAESNINPHLAWSGLPEGTQTLALVFHDFDMPALNRSAAQVAEPSAAAQSQTRTAVPVDLPVDVARSDFFHWVLIDLPPYPALIVEGQYSRGFVARGKPQARRVGPGRQGLNDCTRWWAQDPALRGTYIGYDGPLPAPNDALVHHYVFTLYALTVARLPLADAFTGQQVREAMAGHVLAEATLSGTYTCNPKLLADANARGPQPAMSE